MVETFRIINNIDKLNSNKIFPKNGCTVSLGNCTILPGFTWCRGHIFGLNCPCDPSWFVISICHFRFVYVWGHKHKIYKKQCRTNIRKYSFSQRVVDTWNSLPAKVIESNLDILIGRYNWDVEYFWLVLWLVFEHFQFGWLPFYT
jgi:hypothetical protein